MYYVFVGDNYYPGGGWNDFVGCYTNMEDCWHCILLSEGDWYQIVHDNEIVSKGKKA